MDGKLICSVSSNLEALMLEHDQLAKWIVGLAAEDTASDQAREFVQASQQAWPRVLAHVRRELSAHARGAEITSLALEIWEDVLRSVWKTLRRPNGASEVRDLENYLIGTFHHRLNRRLQQERRRDAILEFVPPEKLIELPARDNNNLEDSAARIDQRIQLNQVYGMLDENVRKAIVARIYGFSWAEIAKTFQIEEQNLIMRVQYAIRKIRGKLAAEARNRATEQN